MEQDPKILHCHVPPSPDKVLYAKHTKLKFLKDTILFAHRNFLFPYHLSNPNSDHMTSNCNRDCIYPPTYFLSWLYASPETIVFFKNAYWKPMEHFLKIINSTGVNNWDKTMSRPVLKPTTCCCGLGPRQRVQHIFLKGATCTLIID